MRVKIFIYSLLVVIFALTSCRDRSNKCSFSIEPLPKICEESEGEFTINTNTQIVVKEFTSANLAYAEMLHDKIHDETGHTIGIIEGYQGRSKNCIIIEKSGLKTLGKYGYELLITPNAVRLRANSEYGYLYAIETFLQILGKDSSIEENIKTGGSKILSLPCAYIMDDLDMSNRVSSVDMSDSIAMDTIFKHLDMMVGLKLNKLILVSTDIADYNIPEVVDIRNYAKKYLIDVEVSIINTNASVEIDENGKIDKKL